VMHRHSFVRPGSQDLANRHDSSPPRRDEGLPNAKPAVFVRKSEHSFFVRLYERRLRIRGIAWL
jgi:hypothetical protein